MSNISCRCSHKHQTKCQRHKCKSYFICLTYAIWNKNVHVKKNRVDHSFVHIPPFHRHHNIVPMSISIKHTISRHLNLIDIIFNFYLCWTKTRRKSGNEMSTAAYWIIVFFQNYILWSFAGWSSSSSEELLCTSFLSLWINWIFVEMIEQTVRSHTRHILTIGGIIHAHPSL